MGAVTESMRESLRQTNIVIPRKSSMGFVSTHSDAQSSFVDDGKDYQVYKAMRHQQLAK